MKTKNIFLIFTIMIHQAIAGSKEPQPLAQSDEGKRMFAVVTEMSSANDIRGLVKTLPEIELLWKKDPVGYLHAMEVNVLALIGSPDPAAANAVLAAFSKVADKKCPADTEVASFYFGIKSNIIGYSGRCVALVANRKHLLMNADFLSEIRVKQIIGYRNKAIDNPGHEILVAARVHKVADLPTEIQKEAVAKAIIQNEEDKKTDRLQKTLLSLGENLSDSLIESSRRLNMPKLEKQEFIRELANRANLTVEEQDMLKSPK